MAASEEEYKQWDEIFKAREEYLEENPDAKNTQRPKTFQDEEGDIRCTKCGSTDDIGGCPECESEVDFLNSSKN